MKPSPLDSVPVEWECHGPWPGLLLVTLMTRRVVMGGGAAAALPCCLFPPPCAIHCVSVALTSLAEDLTLFLSITVGRSQWL